MSANIRVKLQVGKFPSKHDREIVMPLSEELLYEALEKLDLPDVRAPAYAQMLCTSTFKIQHVMAEREHMAKVLSEALTNALLGILNSADTRMGYDISKAEAHK